MTEFLDDLTETPHRITLSGEGLKRMDVRVFKSMVRNLGRIGIEVQEAPLKNQEARRATEKEQNPLALYKKDFVQSAIKHDLSRINVGRTWSALTAPWKKYHHILDKLSAGGNLYSWEKDILEKPAWQHELCIAKDELSRPNLQAAYQSELLSELDGMGPKYLEVVGVVLNDPDS